RRAPSRGSRRRRRARPSPRASRSSDRRPRADEAQLGHLVELAGLLCELEERVETGPLARPEAVAELLEVAGEEAGRVAVALGRLVRERLRVGAGGAERGEEGVLELDELGARGLA